MARVLMACGLSERGRRNALRVRLQHNDVALASLPPACDGYAPLEFSDLHLDTNDRLIESVQGVARDACVLTGDYRFPNPRAPRAGDASAGAPASSPR